MTDEQVAVAAERARAWGFSRPFALAALLLVDVLGVESERWTALDEFGALRRSLLVRMVGEPSHAVVRSATRLLYTTALAPTPMAAARYATAASVDHLRRLLGRGD
jgi:hypothetical protein